MSAAVDLVRSDIARLADGAAPHLRGLPMRERDAVLAAALTRVAATTDAELAELTRKGGTLLTFFCGHVEFARRQMHPDERRACLRSFDAMVAGNGANFNGLFDGVAEELTSEEQKAAAMLYRGESVRQVAAGSGMNRGAVRALQKRLRKLQRLHPDVEPTAFTSARKPEADRDTRGLAQIDVDIAGLEFPPWQGAECPPCIHCLWFEGYRPSNRHRVAGDAVSAEVRAAQEAVYARKVEISARVTGRRPT